MRDPNLDFNKLASTALNELTEKQDAREKALKNSRQIIRASANAIRAIHRDDLKLAKEMMQDTAAMVSETKHLLSGHLDLYFTGFTQDAQKEYTECEALYAFISKSPLPTPNDLGVEIAPYLNGLAEAASELRRYILDLLRKDDDARCEELMTLMDEVYNIMVVIDFPDALTLGLRRTTDALRAVLERTRGDLTLAVRHRRLEDKLALHEKG